MKAERDRQRSSRKGNGGSERQTLCHHEAGEMEARITQVLHHTSHTDITNIQTNKSTVRTAQEVVGPLWACAAVTWEFRHVWRTHKKTLL